MKKVLNIAIFFIISFFLITTTTKAADSCTYKEQQALNKEALNVKINYEIQKNELPSGYKFYADGIMDENGNRVDDTNLHIGYFIKVNIINISSNLKLVGDTDLYDENDNLVKEINYSQTDSGLVTLYSYDLSKVKKASFQIYSINNNCYEKKLIKISVKLPKYNIYSQLDVCSDLSDYEMCDSFYQNNLTETEFIDKVNEYKQSLQKQEAKKSNFFINALNYIKNNVILLIILIIIILVIALIIIFRKRLKIWHRKK